MKRNFFIASAVAALALVGCNKETPKNEAALNSSQREIVFSPYFGRALTKATNGDDIGPIKVTSIPENLNNTVFTCVGGVYTSETPHYWAAASYQFLAVNPTDYSIQEERDENDELIGGALNITSFHGIEDIKIANTGVKSQAAQIDLPFKHALNAVEVYAKLEKELPPDQTITIEKITLSECYTVGLCEFKIGDDYSTDTPIQWTGTEDAQTMIMFDNNEFPVTTTEEEVTQKPLYIIPDGLDLVGPKVKIMTITYTFSYMEEGEEKTITDTFTGTIAPSTDFGQLFKVHLKVKALDQIQFICEDATWTTKDVDLQ